MWTHYLRKEEERKEGMHYSYCSSGKGTLKEFENYYQQNWDMQEKCALTEFEWKKHLNKYRLRTKH